VRDTDKQELLPIARYFASQGYALFATSGTAAFLRGHDIDATVVHPIDEGSPSVMDVLAREDIGLVINTPTRGHKPERDGFRIRRKAVEMNIPCLTSIDTANALIHCLELGKRPGDLPVVDLVTL
jgi:carbamoyl-phosphate synthase large subunit